MATPFKVLVVAVALPLLSTTGATQAGKRVHVRGYLVDIASPTELTVDDYRITLDSTYRVRLSAPSPLLRIGAEVEFDAVADPATGGLLAADIRTRVEPFTQVDQRTIISDVVGPGLLKADGRRVLIDAGTRVTFAKSETPIARIDEVSAGTILKYHAARRNDDGAMVADRADFSRNVSEPGERSLIKDMRLETREPDYTSHKNGSIRIWKGPYYEIVADAAVQQYIRNVGDSLVPPYQRALDEADPTKVTFTFWIVKMRDVGAFALPNGVVLVSSELFETLENEAQLAAIVGHEIAHVTQEHRWAATKRLDWAFDNRYSRAIEDQADRLGVEYMVGAGYDPRQAARVWKTLTMKFGFVQTNAFDSGHDNHAIRRDLLMQELAAGYSGLDYTKLSTGAGRFKEMAFIVKGAVDPGWKKNHPGL